MGDVYAYVRQCNREKGVEADNKKQQTAIQFCAQKKSMEIQYIVVEKSEQESFADRQTWMGLESVLQEGDVVFFYDLKCFAKDYEEGYPKYRELMIRGVELVFVENPTIQTEYIKSLFDIAEIQGNMTKAFFESLVMVLYQKEWMSKKEKHQYLSRRTKEGMAASGNKAGRKVGQIDKMTDELRLDLESFIVNKDAKAIEIMRKHNVSRNTLKKYVSILVEEKQEQLKD